MSKSLPVTLHLFPPGTIFKAQVSRNGIFVCSVNRKFFLCICCCSESKHQCLTQSNSDALYCFKPRAGKTCWPRHACFFSDRPLFCQVFIDPHPECSWSVWCPCMLSTCLGDLPAAQGFNIQTAQTNEFLGAEKLGSKLWHHWHVFTQIGQMRSKFKCGACVSACSFECVPEQQRALNLHDMLQAGAALSTRDKVLTHCSAELLHMV